jgi:protein phosphatase
MFSFWKKQSTKQSHASPRKTAGDASEKTTGEMAAPPDFNCEIEACLLTDVGCVREVNEDSSKYVRPADDESLQSKGSLMLVCDGMGGHSAGEVASRMAVEVISRIYYEEADGAHPALANAFQEANREIYEASQKDQNLKGMGTTGTALVLRNGHAFAAHVGDSRIYLIRNDQIYAMTQDHSEVMEMVRRGLLSLEEARHHPDKNVILRALGSHPQVEVSTWDAPFPLREKDLFLLCSDGLYDLVEDEEIRRLALADAPQPACQSLISLAKERGGHDNITVAIVKVGAASENGAKPVPMTREMEAAI